MQNEDQKREPTPASSGSMKPPRPPRGTVVVGADGGGDDSGGVVKADYGCHEALWALSVRYRDSDIHGAHSALVEQEKLLREHIGFPGYKTQLAFTMARRSNIVRQLGDAQAAAAIMAEAASLLGIARMSEGLLKSIRDLDKNVKWRKVDRAA